MIEALKPLRVRLSDGEIHLTPGKPVRLPDWQAQKLLSKAPNKIRVVCPDWVGEWRQLAGITAVIAKSDRRLEPILDALDRCETAYPSDDWPTFQQAVTTVKRIAHFRP